MKIALVSPKSPPLSRNVEFQDFLKHSPEMEFYRQYWSGLGSGLLVIGALTPNNVELELIDEGIEEIDFSQGYDLVAITAVTQQANRAYEIARRFREKNIRVVLGGIHATILPDEAKLYADSVVVGEAENLWPKLLDDFRHNRLSPIYASQQEVDLKESPIPRYELLEEKPCKIVWVQATRGCPHDCSFCCASRVYGSKYRHKSIDQVIHEINKIRQIKKHALIGFADDNLLCDKGYSRQLLEKVVGLKIKWIGQSDISVADDNDLLRLVKKSGCVALLIGFESIIEDNLRGLDSSNWKFKHLKNYVEGIRAIQGNGIGIIGTFIVGFDNDDISVFNKLAAFIIDNHLAGAQIAALTPFPHTEVRKNLLTEGRVLNTLWENYTLYDVNIKPKKMSPHELEKGILDTFKKVYSPGAAIEKGSYFKSIFSELHQKPK
ncbi:MAG: cobalamin-dependent protein [Dehalococcoidales bacterium]|nr:cobalamin-dependent protein [Dehalococcoidales bacterium]